ncbi:hypothetical protein [Streptomyces aureoversilis]|uniref:Uncharacterized protein n=1 Tax=Streptomyces aureoversilis TaxID=67277 RepID=A0ABV9ZWR1_9ACTN
MTTTSPTPALRDTRDREGTGPTLGRGRRALIPADDDTDLQSPAARARAALAAVQTVPVPVVVLGGLAGLMEEFERLAEAAGEDANRQAARETLAYLRAIGG